MYSKLSYFFFLVGLISQTIAAPHLENEIADSIISDESTIPNFITSPEETTDSNDSFEKTTSSRDVDALMYLEECLERGNSSIFDLDLLLGIKKQIVEPLNHVDDNLLSDEIKMKIELIFDSIIFALNNTNDSDISEPINQATENILYIISSANGSNLKQIIRMIAKLSKKLMGVLMTRNEDVNELIQSMNYKIVTLVMLKEDPPISTYLLDLLIRIMRMIDHYKKQNEFNKAAETLRSTLDQTKKDYTEIVEPLIDYLADEISYIFGMDISDQAKFSAVQCMTEDLVMNMLMRNFMTKFRSEIDS